MKHVKKKMRTVEPHDHAEEFFNDDKVLVNPLRIKQNIANELEFNMMLYYTGTSRVSSDIIKNQVSNVTAKEGKSIEAMINLKEQAVLMKNALLRGELDQIGKILNYGWENKKKMAKENPDYYAQIHRGYSFVPPGGESLEMVEKRIISFLEQLTEWLKQNPGNVAISCHNNSMRPFRRVFENLSIGQMCKLENPQDRASVWDLELGNWSLISKKQKIFKLYWKGVRILRNIKLASDSQNPLKKYY